MALLAVQQNYQMITQTGLRRLKLNVSDVLKRDGIPICHQTPRDMTWNVSGDARDKMKPRTNYLETTPFAPGFGDPILGQLRYRVPDNFWQLQAECPLLKKPS